MKRTALTLALLLASVAVASAQLALSSVAWTWRPELRGFPGRFGKPKPVLTASVAGPRLDGRLGAAVRLVNRGTATAEGILLRYAFSMKVALRNRPQDAVWAVPFLTDEYRVPRLAVGAAKTVPLDPVLLPAIFRKFYRAGYVIRAVRVQVMVEPRPGDTGPLEIAQGEIKAGHD